MRAAYTRLRTGVDLARRGICMECWGRVSAEFPVDGHDHGESTERYDEFTQVAYQCERRWIDLLLRLKTEESRQRIPGFYRFRRVRRPGVSGLGTVWCPRVTASALPGQRRGIQFH
jgi:hypothetical protein